jgi:hypothetical protein
MADESISDCAVPPPSPRAVGAQVRWLAKMRVDSLHPVNCRVSVRLPAQAERPWSRNPCWKIHIVAE